MVGGEASTSAIPPLHLGLDLAILVVWCASNVREEWRECERFSPSFKEWEDIRVVFTPCRHMIFINIADLCD
jgi:hypothetical protein